ncbi:MAG: RluA family pseudouridine synthase [Spirochaetales bacterium]
MEYVELPAQKDDINRRFDRIVRKFFTKIPLSLLYKNMRNGLIRINHKKTRNDYQIQEGDILCIEKKFFEYTQNTEKPQPVHHSDNIDLEIIFSNEHICIINKPYGMKIHSSADNDVSAEKIIRQKYLRQQERLPQKKSLSFMPGPMHRLDRNTTGLVAFSQSLQGAHYFGECMTKKNLQKTYIAVLSGHITKKLHLEHQISESKPSNIRDFATVNIYRENTQPDEKVKHAVTTITPLAQGFYRREEITLCCIDIETGRTHQIRAQSAHCGHPLLADTAYGYKGRATQFLLHAGILLFPKNNPIGIPEKIIAPLPENFVNFIQKHLPEFDILLYNDLQ